MKGEIANLKILIILVSDKTYLSLSKKSVPVKNQHYSQLFCTVPGSFFNDILLLLYITFITGEPRGSQASVMLSTIFRKDYPHLKELIDKLTRDRMQQVGKEHKRRQRGGIKKGAMVRT